MARYTLNHIKKKKGGNVSGIIADDNTITDPIEIAENFNNFFTSIGTNLQKKIQTENFIIAPTNPDEISYLILNPAKMLVLIVFPRKIQNLPPTPFSRQNFQVNFLWLRPNIYKYIYIIYTYKYIYIYIYILYILYIYVCVSVCVNVNVYVCLALHGVTFKKIFVKCINK